MKGSATACILRCLPDEGELHAANLGDSGFLLVRGGNPVFQTPQQQHHFNFPYQLGSRAMGAMNDGPESAQVRSSVLLLAADLCADDTGCVCGFGHRYGGHAQQQFALCRKVSTGGRKMFAAASDGALLRSQLMQLRILPDDIIVSGTDGLFDNVFAEEVASLVTFARKRGDSPALAATVLASYTQMKAAETTHMSPFAYAAQVQDSFGQPLLVVSLLKTSLTPASLADSAKHATG